jgi:hypothetical protein
MQKAAMDVYAAAMAGRSHAGATIHAYRIRGGIPGGAQAAGPGGDGGMSPSVPQQGAAFLLSR